MKDTEYKTMLDVTEGLKSSLRSRAYDERSKPGPIHQTVGIEFEYKQRVIDEWYLEVKDCTLVEGIKELRNKARRYKEAYKGSHNILSNNAEVTVRKFIEDRMNWLYDYYVGE